MSSLPERWRAWADRRPRFDGLHLDSAASGRMSHAVQQAVADHLRRESEAGAYVAEAEAAAVIDGARQQLGALLGVDGSGVVFVESATSALHALIEAWPLPAGATVAVAPSEWATNLRTFRVRGLTVRTLPTEPSGRIDLDELGALLRNDPPGLVHVVAAAAHRALVQPTTPIVEVCRAAGVPVWVDAAQALGQVALAGRPDAVYATSRKWLCGPRGIGILAVAEPWRDRLRAEPWALQPDRPPVARLESDEANIAGRVGLAVAVDEYATSGPEAMARRLDDVAESARAILSDIPGWDLMPALPRSGAILGLRPLAGQDVGRKRQRLLDEHRILVTASRPNRAPLEDAGPSLRLSPHVDTTPDDLTILAKALVAS